MVGYFQIKIQQNITNNFFPLLIEFWKLFFENILPWITNLDTMVINRIDMSKTSLGLKYATSGIKKPWPNGLKITDY